MQYKFSKNPKVEELTKSHKKRNYRLSDLKSENGRCIWCLEQLTGKRYKWCSANCINFALAWSAPQRPNGLYILMVKQDWHCQSCKFDFKPARDAAIKSPLKKHSRSYKKDKYFYLMKGLRSFCNDRKPEVDHIVSVALGGQSIGMENVQMLCSICHKEKSKKDMKERYRVLGNPLKGKKFSEKHLTAISKSRKGFDSNNRKKARESMYEQSRMAISATNVFLNKTIEFSSISEAAKVLNLQGYNISRVIGNKQGRKQHKGWTFKKLTNKKIDDIV